MPRLRCLCFCADDYGMDPGIDAGILATIDAGLVCNVAISVEVPTEALSPKALDRLKTVDIGLHLDLLPDVYDLTRPLDWLLAWPKLLPTKRQIAKQRERLDRALDRLRKHSLSVKFFHGHQHIHLLPGWSEFLAEWGLSNDIKWSRKPFEVGLKADEARRERPGLIALEFLGRRAARLHRRLWWYQSICRWGRDFDWPSVFTALADPRLEAVEVVVHPGFPSANYCCRTKTPLRHARQVELLTQHEIGEKLFNLGWQPARLSEWWKLNNTSDANRFA